MLKTASKMRKIEPESIVVYLKRVILEDFLKWTSWLPSNSKNNNTFTNTTQPKWVETEHLLLTTSTCKEGQAQTTFLKPRVTNRDKQLSINNNSS